MRGNETKEGKLGIQISKPSSTCCVTLSQSLALSGKQQGDTCRTHLGEMLGCGPGYPWIIFKSDYVILLFKSSHDSPATQMKFNLFSTAPKPVHLQASPAHMEELYHTL